MLVLVLVVGVVVGARALTNGGDDGDTPKAGTTTRESPDASGTGTGSDDPTTPGKTGGSPTEPGSPNPTETEDDPTTPGPLNTKFPGLVTFRGNATRTYYGEGPLPKHPEILWQYPQSGGLCSPVRRGAGPEDLVRHGLDRPAQRDRPRQREDRDP